MGAIGDAYESGKAILPPGAGCRAIGGVICWPVAPVRDLEKSRGFGVGGKFSRRELIGRCPGELSTIDRRTARHGEGDMSASIEFAGTRGRIIAEEKRNQP